MSRPEDQRPLPDGDFRAIRAYLADHVFASVPGGGAVPNDPLGQSEWEHLMDLPTDVLLRTTDYLGMMIDDVVTQRSAWTAAMPDDPSQVPSCSTPHSTQATSSRRPPSSLPTATTGRRQRRFATRLR